MTDQDRELGAALRDLPVPEHGPAFFEELEERLAGGSAVAGPSRRGPRRVASRTLLLACAAAVAVVVAATAFLTGDEATRLRVTPPASTPDGAPWAEVSESPLSARRGSAAVWTGKEMFIWGGSGADGEVLPDGAAYDPATDRWKSIAPAPTGPLVDATAVWTGERVLVWGGRVGEPGDPASERAAGAAYDPRTDSWTPISDSPLATVAGHEAVWTGQVMLVWGGSVGELPVAEGAAYDPSSDRWRKLPPAPLDARFDHSAVWTGDRMIVWGGFPGEESPTSEPLADGAAYDPSGDSWSALPAAPVAGRAMHVGVWNGATMVVWGGTGRQGLLADGASYDPRTTTWTVLPPSPLAPRLFASAVVGDGAVLIWGGHGDQGDAKADGAALEAGSRRWRTLPRGPLSPRGRHSAVWTSATMVVWGGVDGQASRADGAALAPPEEDGRAAPTTTTPIAGSPTTAQPPPTTTTPIAGSPTTVPPPATVVAPVRCSDVAFAPNSDNLASDIVAEGITCAEAEAFVRRVGGPLGPVNGPLRVEREGFVCTRTERPDDGLPSAGYECRDGARRITFVRT